MKYDFFCLCGTFLKKSLSKQNFPSPHMLAVCMQGEGESLSFFSKGWLHCGCFCLDSLKSCFEHPWKVLYHLICQTGFVTSFSLGPCKPFLSSLIEKQKKTLVVVPLDRVLKFPLRRIRSLQQCLQKLPFQKDVP